MMWRWLTVGCVAWTLAGCGGGAATSYKDTRFALKGKVTLNGAPLESGTITFQTLQEGIRPTGGPIKNGEYSIDKDNGANKGSYRVEIRSLKSTGKQRKDDDTGEMVDIFEESIPKKYNDASELKADVDADKTVFNFDLTSK